MEKDSLTILFNVQSNLYLWRSYRTARISRITVLEKGDKFKQNIAKPKYASFFKISRTEVHCASFYNCLSQPIYREALLYMTQLRTK